MLKEGMKLKDYLRINNISQYKFAKMCDLDRSAITLLLQGKRFPRPDTLNKIELATDGQVKANDFMKEAQERMVGKL